jgi:hypothetical protein
MMIDTRDQKAPERPDERALPSEAEIDRTLADSFPASDPPSWTRGVDHPTTPKKEHRPPV